jgi:hypothetical protein
MNGGHALFALKGVEELVALKIGSLLIDKASAALTTMRK